MVQRVVNPCCAKSVVRCGMRRHRPGYRLTIADANQPSAGAAEVAGPAPKRPLGYSMSTPVMTLLTWPLSRLVGQDVSRSNAAAGAAALLCERQHREGVEAYLAQHGADAGTHHGRG